MCQNRTEEFTKPLFRFYLLYPVIFKVSIKKNLPKQKHEEGFSRQSLPHHSEHTFNMVLLHFLLCFTHYLHLRKTRSSANVPTWAVARWMSRKPKYSRCNQNMVLVDSLLVWKRPLVCWLELLDSDCVGGKEEGWWRGHRPVWEMAGGGEGLGVCCLCTERKGWGLSSHFLESQSELLGKKKILWKTEVLVSLNLRDWGQTGTTKSYLLDLIGLKMRKQMTD